MDLPRREHMSKYDWSIKLLFRQSWLLANLGEEYFLRRLRNNPIVEKIVDGMTIGQLCMYKEVKGEEEGNVDKVNNDKASFISLLQVRQETCHGASGTWQLLAKKSKRWSNRVVVSREQRCSKSVEVAQEKGCPKNAIIDMVQNDQRALNVADEKKLLENACNYQRAKSKICSKGVEAAKVQKVFGYCLLKRVKVMKLRILLNPIEKSQFDKVRANVPREKVIILRQMNDQIGERRESVKGYEVEGCELVRRRVILWRKELALLSMLSKMFDQVEALETLGGFCQLMLEEFTKLRNEQVGDHMDSGAEYRMAAKKVEFPSFNGTNPVGWITRAETYFEVQGSTEEVKVRLAKLSMEGAAIHWFNLLQEAEVGLLWTKLKRELIGRYGGRTSDNPFEELKDLSQTSSIDKYLAEFEYIVSSISFTKGTISGLFYLRIEIGDSAKGSRVQPRESPPSHAHGSRCGSRIARRGISAWRRSTGLEKQLRLGTNLGRLGVGLGATQGTQTKPLSVGSSSPHEPCSGTQQSSRVFGDRFPAAHRNRDTKHLP
ncbi:hypothetical protein V8G54_005128 [Vigna mungo]|uniref:Retrotransposon gag domain-containing protein n=1 Tax=Vigna mungo TaxID=3915 RepID=A0AAQ3SH19_VIGMU